MKARLLCFVIAMSVAWSGAWSQQRAPYPERPAPYQRQERTHKAGIFDYYVLALSWSPTYCAGITDSRYEPQCQARASRPYAFVLHGLWPQYEQRWPQFCDSPDRGYVPKPVARRMLDIMPSERLIFHEYRKHGTCTGLGVDGYFDLARRFHDMVRIPPRYVALADDRLMVGPGELVREFIAANPKLAPDMIAVECGGPGNRLKEVRICFDKGGDFRACGHNESQHRLCAAEHMYVPPVRGAQERASPEQKLPEKKQSVPERRQDLLPGPRPL